MIYPYFCIFYHILNLLANKKSTADLSFKFVGKDKYFEIKNKRNAII